MKKYTREETLEWAKKGGEIPEDGILAGAPLPNQEKQALDQAYVTGWREGIDDAIDCLCEPELMTTADCIVRLEKLLDPPGEPPKTERLFKQTCSGAETVRWDDKPLPEDKEIEAAHPLETDRHDLYQEAMRLVGARYSKGALVELVNWLLHRCETGKPCGATLEDRDARLDTSVCLLFPGHSEHHYDPKTRTSWGR